MYYFKLHPSVCEFENDSETVIAVYKVPNGYFVVINIGNELPFTDTYTSDEILAEILNGYWVLTNEKENDKNG